MDERGKNAIVINECTFGKRGAVSSSQQARKAECATIGRETTVAFTEKTNDPMHFYENRMPAIDLKLRVRIHNS